MALNRQKLYLFIFLADVVGFIWIIYNLIETYQNGKETHTVCLIKQTTGVPCPSCGSTRSVMSVFNGEWLDAIYWNPLGIVLVIIIFVSPIWIIKDWLQSSDSFFKFYQNAETKLRKPYLAYPLIILVVANWIWNIVKGL